MTTFRLTTIAACVKFWWFFEEGFNKTGRFLRYDLPMDAYRRILFALVSSDNGWVGLCLDDNGRPLGFAIAHECTPLFAQAKEYEASIVYAADDNQDTFNNMQQTFEDFCRAQGVKRYFATTRRDSGAAIRCFQSPRYGFRRAFTTFSKDIK